MKITEMKPVQKRRIASCLMMLGMVLMISPAVASGSLPPAQQAKVEQYKQKMTEWAADPAIVAAVREANAKGSLAGMSNSKWLEVDEKSPTSQAFTTSKAGLMMKKLEEDKQINKLVVRDEKGNLVAASTKPLLYNNAVRPVYINGMKGQPWSAGSVLPDPTTQVKSVQASVPVMDGGKVIGVLHAGITSE